MRALTWHGKHNVQVDTVPDPQIVNPRDAIIKITATAICGSDLHLYDSMIPGMSNGDILGHEFMGEVVEVGRGNTSLQVGQKVVVPFVIACGSCFFCGKEQYSACDNSNPADKSDVSEIAYGYPMSGLFGYSHMTGGYAGGQAEYARVPYSDIGPIVVPDGVEDERVLFLSDIFPTGWMAAENAEIEPGDTVAIWGCGPVGLFAIKSAILMGAGRVIAIDHLPHRLELAVKQETKLGTDRQHVLRETIMACRKGGRVSVPGVYGGIGDKLPIGAFMQKGLTIRTGQTHVQRYLPQLLELIMDGKIDTTDLISHRLPLEQAAEGYRNFHDNPDEWTKVVLKPH